MPWPDSCRVLKKAFSKLVSSKRVVMRVSHGPKPVVKGWAETSIRPLAKSKPMASANLRQKATCWGTGQERFKMERSGCFLDEVILATISERLFFRGGKSWLSLAVVRPGS